MGNIYIYILQRMKRHIIRDNEDAGVYYVEHRIRTAKCCCNWTHFMIRRLQLADHFHQITGIITTIIMTVIIILIIMIV